jgi:RimJ/RimL family protein N-acetyltransferase
MVKSIIFPDFELRALRLSDAHSFAKNANNPLIANYLRDAFPYPYTVENAKNFIQSMANSQNNYVWGIDVNGEACGAIGLHQLSDVYRFTAEIGYWLGEPFWNRKILSRGVMAVIDFAFNETDFVRLQAGVFSNNAASAKVLENCGFDREGIHRKAIYKKGQLLDEWMYACVKG